jgi:hypothetical protein
MQVAGRDVDAITALAVLTAALGLVGTVVFGWSFGEGLDNPIVWVIGAGVAALAVYLSVTR